MTVSYMPVSETWEVREMDDESRVVQRRKYDSEEKAVEWIEGVGAVLVSAL